MAVHELSTITEAYWIHSLYLTRRGCRYFVHALERVQDGVKEVTGVFPSYDEEQIRHLLSREDLLPRPFTLEDGRDSTNGCCALALYCAFCHAHALDPVAVWRSAYLPWEGQRYSDPDLDWNVREAEWQGLVYPERWAQVLLRLLLKRLCSMNWAQLAAAILQTPPLLAVGQERIDRWRQEW